jgi:hypothetical protein
MLVPRPLFRPLAGLALAFGVALPARADALSDGIAAMNRKDYPAALQQLEPLAKAGNAQAQLRLDRKSTRLNSSHRLTSRMPSSA